MGKGEEKGEGKGYLIKHDGKWISPRRVLGGFAYDRHDLPGGIEPMSRQKALAARSLMCEDEGIPKDMVEVIEAEGTAGPR